MEVGLTANPAGLGAGAKLQTTLAEGEVAGGEAVGGGRVGGAVFTREEVQLLGLQSPQLDVVRAGLKQLLDVMERQGLLAGAGVVFMGASKAESRNHEVWAAGEPAYVKLWLQSPAGLTSTLALEAEEGFAPDLVYCVAAAYLRRCGVACSRLKRFPSLTRPGAVTLQWTMRAMRPTTEEPSEEELRVLQLFPPFSLDICPDSMQTACY
ncbi:hypothetical protein V8C86DRAFT_286596 [Haematococcus lacustris]